MTYEGHGDQRFGHITYSQSGEDLFILSLFEQMGIHKPSYLDIGAHHPFHISNTALMYSRGCRGVNIEANPNLIPAFLEHRPEDKTVNIGCGPVAGVLPFYMFDYASGRNTFDPEMAKPFEHHGQKFEVTEVKEIKIETLPQIVIDYCGGVFPDFVSLDCEGFDLAIVRQAPWHFNRPKIFCVEALPEHEEEITWLMYNRTGYSKHHRIVYNNIYW